MGKRWRHVVLNTRCSWLHGEERGFRSRGHRIHSSGDYKHRPPKAEHEGLRNFHGKRSRDAIDLNLQARIEIVRAFVLKARALGHEIIACACGEQHLHAQIELPWKHELMKREVGKCKQRASYVVRQLVPGVIWSEGGTFKLFEGVQHFHCTYDYIRLRQEAGLVVWSHRPEENWIDDPTIAIIVMGSKRSRTRIEQKSHAGV